MNFELIITALLRENIHYEDSLQLIGGYINKIMLQSENLKALHKRKGYKNYVFSNFYPSEKDKIYKKDRVYVIRLKSLDYRFLKDLKECLPTIKNYSIQCLSLELKQLPQKHIVDLYTITPVVITVDNKPFLPEDSLDVLCNRLQANLEKKYKAFYGEELFTESFIQRIEFINRKPIKTNYKGIKLLGNKFKITVKDDEKSQLLAKVAVGAGIGEKNSALGCGFCFANYL
ncbi:CRISPR-associated endoribonuclease Cas6 [Bacillus thuringiensis serovar pingluonsis]|uniref:CRISPR-associated endoribonuclease Cas6 n=2 Tax=Bacillus thuringiensis TaxID=1428 RepID=A0A9W3VG05_BACTU|nr:MULTISPECIES: CRISPR-associated endoribonuclease Cas6 [Bacillus cereus group]AMR06121.1 CRISPR-associated protein Cas6 [Bacillus thuringiensis]AYF84847.1 CRISPR-associated endoribonuclease Cas6 [Bacillus thuringiensis]MEB9684683.1 CRISPR-associated endoribonuclease Cas6 [Bacillus anthracis]MEC2744679.1 CRISPR-associated endoribonuclease Cas6 [Bacillus cereus]MEC2758478.1 CRISPR-associated endoribonuclease Cas6 [Bacillus cereus]